MSKPTVKATLPLSKDERLTFVNAVLAARKKNPAMGWKALFDEGRKKLKPNRMSKNIDHPNKLAWIKDMLKVEEPATKQNGKKVMEQKIAPVQTKLKPRSCTPYSEEEKLRFATAFYEFQKANPHQGNLAAIRAANDVMPEHRKIGKNLDSVKQIAWLIPLLEKLENPPKVETQSRFTSKLSDEQKEEFASIAYKLKKGGATWTHAVRTANSFMPEGNRIANSIINPSGLPWLQRAIDKLTEADKDRVVIDHRNTLPKATDEHQNEKHERKHSTTKTHWNDEDKQLFAEVAYQLKICNPGWGWQQILDMANKEMPGHKQRPKMPPSPSQIPWLYPMFDEIAKRPPERFEPEPAPVASPVAVQAAPAPSMDMQAMMMAAFEKIAREQLAMGNVPAVINGAIHPEKTEKPQKKKVVVVGLLPVQTNDIQKRFGHKFDLKFIGSNTPAPQIRDAMKHADIGVLMTRFVSHSTQAAMRSFPGFNFCNGNSTALENLLEEKVISLGVGQ